MRQPLLGGELQRVVVLDGGGSVQPLLPGAVVLQRRIAGEVRTRNRRAVGQQHILPHVVDGGHVIGMLPDVASLHRQRIPELAVGSSGSTGSIPPGDS